MNKKRKQLPKKTSHPISTVLSSTDYEAEFNFGSGAVSGSYIYVHILTHNLPSLKGPDGRGSAADKRPTMPLPSPKL
jgi:hypothetical protein